MNDSKHVSERSVMYMEPHSFTQSWSVVCAQGMCLPPSCRPHSPLSLAGRDLQDARRRVWTRVVDEETEPGLSRCQAPEWRVAGRRGTRPGPRPHPGGATPHPTLELQQQLVYLGTTWAGKRYSGQRAPGSRLKFRKAVKPRTA